MRLASWLVVLLFLGTVACDLATAAEPPVLVLRRPPITPHSPNYPALQPVTASYYPYGYFGAHGNPRWTSHRGVLGNYSQVTRR